MTEGPFTGKWVRENLGRPKRGDKRPDDAGCDRIAAEFNRAYVREKFAGTVDSPHIFWVSRAPATPTIHPDERRWAGLLALGEAVCNELNAANRGRKPPFAYTEDGPAVKLLREAIPSITDERPTAGAIAMEFRNASNRI
jgi:hypothetical protein